MNCIHLKVKGNGGGSVPGPTVRFPVSFTNDSPGKITFNIPFTRKQVENIRTRLLGRDENAYQGYRSKVDLYQEWSGWISDAGPESVERLKLCLSIQCGRKPI